jgi:hypothetical protein
MVVMVEECSEENKNINANLNSWAINLNGTSKRLIAIFVCVCVCVCVCVKSGLVHNKLSSTTELYSLPLTINTLKNVTNQQNCLIKNFKKIVEGLGVWLSGSACVQHA